jgi:hypothetical protein
MWTCTSYINNCVFRSLPEGCGTIFAGGGGLTPCSSSRKNTRRERHIAGRPLFFHSQKKLNLTYEAMRKTFCAMSSCGLKSRISITAGHRPAGRMRTLHDCLKGRTSNGRMVETGHALSLHDCQAASRGRRPIRGSMTRGYLYFNQFLFY